MRVWIILVASGLAVQSAVASVGDDTKLLSDVAAAVRGGDISRFIPHAGDVERALGSAQPRSDGPYPRLALYAARYYLFTGDSGAIVRVLDEGLAATSPDNPLGFDLLVLRGQTLQKHGRWIEALANFDSALALPGIDFAQRALAQRGRGAALAAMWRLADAQTAWRAALALEPGDPDAVVALADIDKRVKDMAKAGAAPITPATNGPPPAPPPPPSYPAGFRPARAVGVTHDCASLYPPLALRFGEEGAVTVRYDVAVDGSIGDVTLAATSGFGRLDDGALACVRVRWKDMPATQDDVPVASPDHMARILFSMGPPTTADELVDRGTRYIAAGRFGRAIESVDSAIALDPDMAVAYQVRAQAWDDLGKHDRAIADRAKAAALATPPDSH